MNLRAALAQRNNELVQRLAKNIQKTGRPLRLTFYVTDSAKWSCSSLYEALRRDPRTSTSVAVDSSPISIDYDENCDFFSRRGYHVDRLWDPASGKRIPVLDLRPDIIFYQQPWYIQPESSIETTSSQALAAYIPYGYMLIDDNKSHYDLPFHHHLWRYFAENPFLQNLYANFSPEAMGIVSLGYPKMDEHATFLKIPSEKDPIAKPTHVIYAPHWSVSTTKWSFSTFEKYGEEILNYARSHPHIYFTYRPHPNLQDQLVKDGIMQATKYSAYLEAWRSLPNAAVSEAADYCNLFHSSDLLVTDSISFLAEYLITGKPIIRLDNPASIGLNQFGEHILSFTHRARSRDDLMALLKQHCLAGNLNRLYSASDHQEELFPSCGAAGSLIKNHIMQEMGI